LWYGLFLLGVASFTWCLAAWLIHPFLPEAKGRKLGRKIISDGFAWHLGVLTRIGAARFDLSAVDALKDAGPLVLAPNHPGLLDALLIVSRLPNVACVMKAAILKNPFLGGGARLARYIPNDRPLKMVHAACTDLAQGGQVLIFPEGTRTTRWPFNAEIVPTVALIAKKAKVPVQTLIIETDTDYLGKHGSLFRLPPMPFCFRIRLGRRFDPPADNATASAQFNAELQAYFTESVAQSTMRPPSASDC
jgi:1-acyl-sn-glycerol-3-phosphate acyltransferase